MNLPFLNSNKFYKPDVKKNIDTMAFRDFVDFRNGSKEHFKQSFLGYARNIYYQDFLGGVYGFTSDNVTIDNQYVQDKLTTIYYNVIQLGGNTALFIHPYTVTLAVGVAEIGKTLVIKTNEQVSVQLLDGTTSVSYINNLYPLDGIVTIPLSQNYTNLVVKLRSDVAAYTDVEIKGIAVVEDALDYTFNGFNRTSKLIDISQFGAVYLITSESETTFLPTPIGGDEYSDVIRKYRIDGRMDQVGDYLRVVLGSKIFKFRDLTLNPSIGLSKNYDWISYEAFPESAPGANDDYVILEVAHYELNQVAYYDDVASLVFNFPITYISQRIDTNYWYQADGLSANLNNLEVAYAEIDGVIRAKTENDNSIYLDYSGGMSCADAFVIAKPLPVFLELTNVGIRYIGFGSDNGELMRIKKIAQIRPLVSCATFEIDGNVSEPFEILSLEQSIERKLLNLEYSHSEDFQGLAFDNYGGAMLLPFYLESDDTQEVTIFNGQKANIIRGSQNLKTEIFTNYLPIPVYLKVKLQMIFNFDDIKIDDTNYGIVDQAEAEQLETSLMYDFSVKVRENNFNYLNL